MFFVDASCRPPRSKPIRSSAIPSAGVLILACTIPAGLRGQQAPVALVFERVTVVDVEAGTLLPDQRVIVRGNRIEGVGSTSRVETPAGAQVVDGWGKYLIPGLWDMHVHPGIESDRREESYLLLLANGVTGFRDASTIGTKPPLNTLIRWREEILAGTKIGPSRQIFSARICRSTHCQDSTQVGLRMDSLRAAGVDMFKFYFHGVEDPAVHFSIAARARRLGIPFGGHLIPESVSAIMASDSGMSIVDHFWGSAVVDRKLGRFPDRSGGLAPLCWRFADRRGSVAQCRPVAERLRRNNTWVVPTLARGARRADQGAIQRSEYLVELLARRFDEFAEGTLPAGNWLRDSTDTVVGPSPTDSLAEPLGVMAVAERVDLPVLAGTDMHQMGFALHVELAMAVVEGLSALHALQSATLNPAKMWQATDSLGTVAPGKLADLVLLDANPLADITNTTTIRAVVANGRYFNRAALDSMLAKARVPVHARKEYHERKRRARQAKEAQKQP